MDKGKTIDPEFVSKPQKLNIVAGKTIHAGTIDLAFPVYLATVDYAEMI
jgi:hypothetical protein